LICEQNPQKEAGLTNDQTAVEKEEKRYEKKGPKLS